MPYDYRLEGVMEPYFDVHWISKLVADHQPVSDFMQSRNTRLYYFSDLPANPQIVFVCHARTPGAHPHFGSR